jgi:hypothetical protein
MAKMKTVDRCQKSVARHIHTMIQARQITAAATHSFALLEPTSEDLRDCDRNFGTVAWFLLMVDSKCGVPAGAVVGVGP